MDPNNPNDPYYDPFDVYFKDDRERYLRGYVAYEEFVALCDQEAGGSGSGSGEKRTRTYILHEREEAEQRLINDYFGDDENDPKYTEEKFRRKFRVSSKLFNKILNDILSYDVHHLLEYFYFLDNVTMHVVV